MNENNLSSKIVKKQFNGKNGFCIKPNKMPIYKLNKGSLLSRINNAYFSKVDILNDDTDKNLQENHNK